jgi:hypothetical protein
VQSSARAASHPLAPAGGGRCTRLLLAPLATLLIMSKGNGYAPEGTEGSTVLYAVQRSSVEHLTRWTRAARPMALCSFSAGGGNVGCVFVTTGRPMWRPLWAWRCPRKAGAPAASGDRKAEAGCSAAALGARGGRRQPAPGVRRVNDLRRSAGSRRQPGAQAAKTTQARHATVSTSAPSGVMRMVCSYCAASPPSAVTTVHLSFHSTKRGLPSVKIGSMVKVELSCARWTGGQGKGVRS